MAQQPIRFHGKPIKATRPVEHNPANGLAPGSQPLTFQPGRPAPPEAGSDALRAERLQAKVRARLLEVDPALADATVWEAFDADAGRADAIATVGRAVGDLVSTDVWLLCQPSQLWLLVVGYLTDEEDGAFRELARERFEDPAEAADAFRREYRARNGS